MAKIRNKPFWRISAAIFTDFPNFLVKLSTRKLHHPLFGRNRVKYMAWPTHFFISGPSTYKILPTALKCSILLEIKDVSQLANLVGQLADYHYIQYYQWQLVEIAIYIQHQSHIGNEGHGPVSEAFWDSDDQAHLLLHSGAFLEDYIRLAKQRCQQKHSA